MQFEKEEEETSGDEFILESEGEHDPTKKISTPRSSRALSSGDISESNDENNSTIGVTTPPDFDFEHTNRNERTSPQKKVSREVNILQNDSLLYAFPLNLQVSPLEASLMDFPTLSETYKSLYNNYQKDTNELKLKLRDLNSLCDNTLKENQKLKEEVQTVKKSGQNTAQVKAKGLALSQEVEKLKVQLVKADETYQKQIKMKENYFQKQISTYLDEIKVLNEKVSSEPTEIVKSLEGEIKRLKTSNKEYREAQLEASHFVNQLVHEIQEVKLKNRILEEQLEQIAPKNLGGKRYRHQDLRIQVQEVGDVSYQKNTKEEDSWKTSVSNNSFDSDEESLFDDDQSFHSFENSMKGSLLSEIEEEIANRLTPRIKMEVEQEILKTSSSPNVSRSFLASELTTTSTTTPIINDATSPLSNDTTQSTTTTTTTTTNETQIIDSTSLLLSTIVSEPTVTTNSENSKIESESNKSATPSPMATVKEKKPVLIPTTPPETIKSLRSSALIDQPQFRFETPSSLDIASPIIFESDYHKDNNVLVSSIPTIFEEQPPSTPNTTPTKNKKATEQNTRFNPNFPSLTISPRSFSYPNTPSQVLPKSLLGVSVDSFAPTSFNFSPIKKSPNKNIIGGSLKGGTKLRENSSIPKLRLDKLQSLLPDLSKSTQNILRITNPAFFAPPLPSSRLSFLEKENERLQNEVFELQRKLTSDEKKATKKVQENSINAVIVEENISTPSNFAPPLLEFEPKSDDLVERGENFRVAKEKTHTPISTNNILDGKKKTEIQNSELESLKKKEMVIEREKERLAERVLEIDYLIKSLTDMNSVLEGIQNNTIENSNISRTNNFEGGKNQSNSKVSGNSDSYFWKPWRFFYKQ